MRTPSGLAAHGMAWTLLTAAWLIATPPVSAVEMVFTSAPDSGVVIIPIKNAQESELDLVGVRVVADIPAESQGKVTVKNPASLGPFTIKKNELKEDGVELLIEADVEDGEVFWG